MKYFLLILFLSFPAMAEEARFYEAHCPRWVLHILGSPFGRPKNPDGPGYGVIQLEDNVRKGILTWEGNRWSYLTNSTAAKLRDLVSKVDGDRRLPHFLYDRPEEGELTLNYVVRTDGSFVVGEARSKRIYDDFQGRVASMPHPTLAAADGAIARVLGAGTITFRNGKILLVTNESGHYQPDEKSLPAVKKALEEFADIFHPEFKGYDFRVYR